MLKFKRYHLFEFEDQHWFPSLFRGYITDYLKYMSELGDFYKPIVGLLQEVLTKTQCFQVIDLCSGSGGPILKIQKELKHEGLLLHVVLTDKYPYKDAFKTFDDPDLTWIKTSVEATSVPFHLKGLRTLFSSFHHFKPEQAKNIVQDAVNNNVPIGVFELSERALFNIFFAPFITLPLVLISCLFIKPYSIKRFFWTYIIPVVPLVCLWDSWVSSLRAYTPDELKKMINDIEDHQKFHWDIGKVKSKGCNITYLLGYPVTTEV